MFEWRRRREEDLERELRAHLELEAEEQSGDMAAAKRALGNVALIQEETRENWGWMWLERLRQDVRYGARLLSRDRGFATVTILTVALGIGANTSIFSVLDAVLLRPLPYREAEQLVSPVTVGKLSALKLGVADFQYGAWREQATVLEGIAAYANRRYTITGGDGAEQLRAQWVTPGFLGVLGIAPAIGRDFTAAEAAPRGGKVAIISDALWARHFGRDPGILSRTMTLDGKPYSIGGVLPRRFEFPENTDADVLLAMPEPPAQPGNGTYYFSAIARMKRGVTVARAHADLAIIDQRLQAAYPKNFDGGRAGSYTAVVGLHDRLVGDVRPALISLAGAVALVLLIVCVNVSNLLLARAIARQKEIAVRIALGAAKGRVARQLLTEAALLAGAGGVAGLGLAYAGVGLLRAIAPAGVPHVNDAHIGGVVLAFNFAVAAGAGLLVGLAPLRGVSSLDPDAALKQATKSASGGRAQKRLESALVVAEVAFALILLSGAGLLLRTVTRLTAIAPGFQADNITTAQFSLPYWKYSTPERQRAFRDMLLERTAAGPGVEAVGAASCLPYSGFAMTSALQIEGRQETEPRGDNVALNYVAGDYFRAIGVPVIEGRAVSASDAAGRPAAVVVNQQLARRYFAAKSAVGARIKLGGVTGWLEVVGVVGDIKQGGLASEPRMEMFQPAAQADGGFVNALAVRSTADPRSLAPWLRKQITAIDKDLPAPEIETMRARMASLMNTQMFVMRILLLFAGIAIALAAIGIYSVLVYAVERRRREIGIRIALGAKRGHIVGLVVGRGLRLACVGSALGIAGGLGATRYLQTLLYGVKPDDPVTLAAGFVVVALVALGAAYIPARRAVESDALTTLRTE